MIRELIICVPLVLFSAPALAQETAQSNDGWVELRPPPKKQENCPIFKWIKLEENFVVVEGRYVDKEQLEKFLNQINPKNTSCIHLYAHVRSSTELLIAVAKRIDDKKIKKIIIIISD